MDGTEFDWKCKCNTVRKQSGSGYKNLVSNVREKHPEDLLALRNEPQHPSSTASSLSTPVSFIYGKRAEQLYGWIDFFVSGLQPFSIVSNAPYRKHTRYEEINREILGKYMRMLTVRDQEKIGQELPSQFAIVFDGCSAGDTHYVACFASYHAANNNVFSLRLLGFSPLEEESIQSAKCHYDYLEFENVIAVVGENCSCYRSLANLIGCPLLGCCSHRFHFCVQDFIRESKAVIEKVNNIMRKLR